MASLLLHLEHVVRLLVRAHRLPTADVYRVSGIVGLCLVGATRALKILLFSLVGLHLLLRLNFELEGLLDFVGGGRGPMRLREKSAGSWCNKAGVL